METEHRTYAIVLFREWLLKNVTGELRPFLPRLAKPFFLVAATGIGKTVVVPVERLRLAMQIKGPEARIAVVEPKIAIAQELTRTMNGFWRKFCAEKNWLFPDLFGCRSSADKEPTKAKIVFMTTGLFAILARRGAFRPNMDSVVLDEAHDTLAGDHAVELGIALATRAGVRVDFMSATVDLRGMRFPQATNVVHAMPARPRVWKVTTRRPLEQCVREVVEGTIVNFDPHGPFAVGTNEPLGLGVNAALSEVGRAKGALVIVTSCAAEKSDLQRVVAKLRRHRFSMPVEFGTLDGRTAKDPAKKREYEAMIRGWSERGSRYVLVATSVVEMGVTLPDLDVVITSDSTVSQDEEGIVRRATLGANALTQRIGRVGRKRAGLAIICTDADRPAPYALASTQELNRNADTLLAPEAITLPMSHGELNWLAWHSFKEGWPEDKLERKCAELGLLSAPERIPERMTELRRCRGELVKARIARGANLACDIEALERWVGRYDLSEANSLLRMAAKYPPCGLPAAHLAYMATRIAVKSLRGKRPDLVETLGAPDVGDEIHLLCSIVGSTESREAEASSIIRQDLFKEAEAHGISSGYLRRFMEMCRDVMDLFLKFESSRVRTCA